MGCRLLVFAILLWVGSAFARGRFDVEIGLETETIVDSMQGSRDAGQAVYIGTGRSPTSVIGSLQNRNFAAINFPISDFSNWFAGEAQWESRNSMSYTASEETLHRLMDRLIPRSYFASKKIVLVDLAASGRGLANFAVALKKYALVRGLTLPELELQYLGEPLAEVKVLLMQEKIPFAVQSISTRMRSFMVGDGFGKMSEFGRLSIEDGRTLYWPRGDHERPMLLDKNLEKLVPRSEYRDFRESLQVRGPASMNPRLPVCDGFAVVVSRI